MIGFKLNLSGQPISNIEKKCNIMSSASRRNYKDVLFSYKFLNGKIVCTQLLNKIHFRMPQMNTCSVNTFYTENCKRNFILNSPINRLFKFYITHIMNDLDVFYNSINLLKLYLYVYNIHWIINTFA